MIGGCIRGEPNSFKELCIFGYFSFFSLQHVIMADAFLGLKISVLLASGLRVEGVVSFLEPSTQQMTLTDGTTFLIGVKTST